MLPIAIGSFAFSSFHNQEYRDVDLICAAVHISAFKSKAAKTENGLLVIGEHKFDLIEAKPDTCDMLILQECNDGYATGEISIRSISLYGITILIPPIEILYAIYKSHIHRVLPLTPSRIQNVDIWMKHMKKYNMIRESLNYKIMDKIIYGEKELDDDITRERKIDEPKLPYLIRLIFLHRFAEVNQRIGDTNISLDKTEDEFFTDNVKRYIDHDKLHEYVGMMYRSSPELIFKKYQTDPNSVSLDKETFLRSDHKTRIQMLIEEITVLFLERKWIPELVECYKKDNIPYNGFIKEQKKQELYDIISHFVTNLCGQGHHWLRRYCLDHYQMLSNLDIYNFSEIEKLAMSISDIKHSQGRIKDPDAIINEIKNIQSSGKHKCGYHIKPLEDEIRIECKGKITKDDNKVQLTLPKLVINNYQETCNTHVNDDSSDTDSSQGNSFEAEGSSLKFICGELELTHSHYDKIVNIMERFHMNILKTFIIQNTNDILVLCDKHTFVGIMYNFNSETIQVFNIAINESDYQYTKHNKQFTAAKKIKKEDVHCNKEHITLTYSGNIITFHKNNTYGVDAMDIMYQGHYHTVYYRSSGCVWSESENVFYYLSSYGQCPEYLQPMFEANSRNLNNYY